MIQKSATKEDLLPAQQIENWFVAGASFGFPRLLVIKQGRAYPFDLTDEASAYRIIGVSKNSGIAGERVRVVETGWLESLGQFLPDTIYYAQNGGNLSAVPPSSGVMVKVGVSIDSNTLIVDRSNPVVLL